MTRFAPAWTAFCSTSSVAIDVVTTPVTMVDGSPALNVSTSSLLQPTPMFFFTRSTISRAVTPTAARVSAWSMRKGEAAAPAAVSATKWRLEMVVIWISAELQLADYHPQLDYADQRRSEEMLLTSGRSGASFDVTCDHGQAGVMSFRLFGK